MKWLGLLISLNISAQPVLKPISFGWEPPSSLFNVMGYQLNYGEQDFVQLPVHQLEYRIPEFNLGYSKPVSIFSLGTTQPSDTNTIYVANYIAIHEESTNGVDWVSKKIEQVTFERQPTSMIRVRLQLTIPTNNAGN